MNTTTANGANAAGVTELVGEEAAMAAMAAVPVSESVAPPSMESVPPPAPATKGAVLGNVMKPLSEEQIQAARDELYEKLNIPPALRVIFNKLLPEETLEIRDTMDAIFQEGVQKAYEDGAQEGYRRGTLEEKARVASLLGAGKAADLIEAAIDWYIHRPVLDPEKRTVTNLEATRKASSLLARAVEDFNAARASETRG